MEYPLFKYPLFVSLRNSIYLDLTLISLGIIIQNNKINFVKADTEKTGPYIRINEGIVLHPKIYTELYKFSDVEVYSKEKLIFDKRTQYTSPHIINVNGEDVYDMYNDIDRLKVLTAISDYEKSKDIFLLNTEPIPKINSAIAIAGLASGTMTANLAYNSCARKIIFFDYNQNSLDFQKELIQTNDRKKVYVDQLDNLTLGYNKASLSDIDNLPFFEINNYYDYLKTVEVQFLLIDIRKNEDVELLFNAIPKNGILWISNVLTYITTLNHYSLERYKLLDKLALEKNINILPHTRIYYES